MEHAQMHFNAIETLYIRLLNKRISDENLDIHVVIALELMRAIAYKIGVTVCAVIKNWECYRVGYVTSAALGKSLATLLIFCELSVQKSTLGT